jgi:signal transduction histidine kinase/DNA-binding response OmpR family regulator
MSGPLADGPVRLLVVDDEPAVIEVVLDFLTESGYEVRAVHSAEEGLGELARWHPDAVLTDINLPGQSGIELVRAVRGRDPEACVIVMTGQASTRTAIEALRHGAYDYVQKPFDLHELQQAIERGVRARRLAEANRALIGELKEANEALQRHERELQQRVQIATHQMSTLFDLSKSMAKDLSLQFRLAFVCEKSAELTGGRRSVLFLRSDGEDAYAARAAVGVEGARLQGLAFGPGETLGGVAVEHQVAIRRAGAAIAEEGKADEPLRALAPESVLIVPLVADRVVLGAVVVLDKPGGFTQHDEDSLTLFAGSAAIALNNAILHERTLELDRLKSEFVAVVSHEIRTPLTVIKGVIELLADDRYWQVDDKQAQLLTMAQSNAERLLRLINDILDFSKLQSANLPMSFAAGHLAQVVEAAADNLQPLLEERGVRISVQLAPDLPLLILDEHRVGQVLLNLLSNAVKFSPKGATVTVAAAIAGDDVVVTVRDEGEGIAPKDLPRLFQKFSQLDSSSTRRAGGTGLGLAICKGIVEAHGGRIWVESEVGAGSTFHFALPLGGPRTEDPLSRELAELAGDAGPLGSAAPVSPRSA